MVGQDKFHYVGKLKIGGWPDGFNWAVRSFDCAMGQDADFLARSVCCRPDVKGPNQPAIIHQPQEVCVMMSR